MWPFRKRPGEEENSGEKIQQPTRLRMTQNDRIRNLIRHEMFRQAAGQEGHESFEEADDFDLPDEEWVSPYEEKFDPDFDHPPAKLVKQPAPTPSAPASAPQPVE